MKENRHAAKGSLWADKQKDFSIQKCVDSQPETKIESGRLMSHRAQSTELQNFMAAKLKCNFFVLLRVAFNISITSHLIGERKNSAEILLVLKFSRWNGVSRGC